FNDVCRAWAARVRSVSSVAQPTRSPAPACGQQSQLRPSKDRRLMSTPEQEKIFDRPLRLIPAPQRSRSAQSYLVKCGEASLPLARAPPCSEAASRNQGPQRASWADLRIQSGRRAQSRGELASDSGRIQRRSIRPPSSRRSSRRSPIALAVVVRLGWTE